MACGNNLSALQSTIMPEPTLTFSTRSTPDIYASMTLMPGFLIDGHEDIAWNALEYGRDPNQSALFSRPAEAVSGLANLVGERATGLPEWLAGRVGIIFATLFALPLRREPQSHNIMVYTTPPEAEVHAHRQMAYYHKITAESPAFRLVTSTSILSQVLKTWVANSDPNQRLVGLVPLMEGADAIVSPGDAASWYQSGLRIVGLSWAATQYAGGTGEPGPLTDLGRQLLKEMGRLNMALDLSHCSEEAFLEAVEVYPATIIASHSNPRLFLPTDRGLSDEMIKKLAGRDGVMGIVPFNKFLVPGWKTGSLKAGIGRVVAAIDYVVQLTGSPRHVAIGTDFDGGLGPEALPDGMNTIADIQKIISALQLAGYSESDIKAILHGNWLRILQNILPTG